MNETVVVILHEAPLRDAIAQHLRQAGFSVSTVASVEAGVPLVHQARPRLVILTWGPADGDLGVLCRRLRWNASTLLLILTSGDDVVDAAAALEAGADQCLSMPTSAHELLAHVRALLRRQPFTPDAAPQKIHLGDLTITLSPPRLAWRGREIHLAAREFEILALLAQHADRVVRREDLMRQIWGNDPTVRPQTLDVHVFSLRRKIEEDPARPLRLLTVRGIGYRLVAYSDDGSRDTDKAMLTKT